MTTDPLTLPALLRRNAMVRGDVPALISEWGSLSHDRLDADSTDVARRLVASGVNKSSRVGLLMENGIEWAVLAGAIMRTGAVLVPLSTLLRPPELHHQLQTAGCHRTHRHAGVSGAQLPHRPRNHRARLRRADCRWSTARPAPPPPWDLGCGRPPDFAG